MSDYFDSLADIVSPQILEKVAAAGLDAIHRGAGRPDEPVLKHEVRVMVELVRAEERAKERAKAEEQAQAKHESLRAHYRQMEETAKQAWSDAIQQLREVSGLDLAQAQYVRELARRHRAKGSKFVRLEHLLTALGWRAADWHAQSAPRPALDVFGVPIDYAKSAAVTEEA